MSLMIHTVVREGIVVAADSRTTHSDGKGNVRYDDTAEKIVPFPNRIVVSHCDDAMVNNNLTVTDFLMRIRSKYGSRGTIVDLPMRILNEYVKAADKLRSSVFLVSGFYDGLPFGCTYKISTKDREIVLVRNSGSYGASYNGVTNVAHVIMSSVTDYSDLSVKEAISLTKCCMDTNVAIAQFWSSQSVGGNVRMYVIDRLHGNTGWFLDDGSISSDKNAPDDAFIKYEEARLKKLQRELMKDDGKNR